MKEIAPEKESTRAQVSSRRDTKLAMRINHLAVALLIAAWSTAGHAQDPHPNKSNDLATAISRAEGFGIPGTIPSRYHNPGDLKASTVDQLAGQALIGKAGHIVFKDDEAG